MTKTRNVFSFLTISGLFAVAVLLTGCAPDSDSSEPTASTSNAAETIPDPAVIVREEVPAGSASATFAGGCFWCTEAAFQETEGVTNAISGYAGGIELNPTYEDVYMERTGHREAIRIYYDPAEVSYQELLDIFWRTIDPTDADGQFVDRGHSYTTAIFYENAEQQAEAEASKRALEDSGRFDEAIATGILPFTTFYQAEDYHQDFYLNSAERYQNYTGASGREEFKARAWAEIQASESHGSSSN